MVVKAVLLSSVAAAISFTIAEAVLFRPLREWAKERAAFLGKLLSCCYCFGFWVSFALVAIYRPRLFDFWWPLDYFLTAIVIAWLSGIQSAMLCWLMDKAGK